MSFSDLRRLSSNHDEQEAPMSNVKSKLNLTQVGRVCVTVSDTDRAIDFYVDTLGFEKVVDVPMGDAGRWVEVALPGAVTSTDRKSTPLNSRHVSIATAVFGSI